MCGLQGGTDLVVSAQSNDKLVCPCLAGYFISGKDMGDETDLIFEFILVNYAMVVYIHNIYYMEVQYEDGKTF